MKKTISKFQKKKKVIWLGPAPGAGPYALWNFFEQTFFDVFYIKKPCHRLAIAILGNTLPIMAPKSALAPRLSRYIRVPQPPYSSMWCPYVTPKRSKRPLAANGCVGNRIVFVMLVFWKFFDRKIMVSSFFHHDDGAPQWRAWGPPTGPIPVTGRPYSGMRYFSI